MLLKESDMNNFNFRVNMSLHFNIIFCFFIVFVFGFWFCFVLFCFVFLGGGGGCGRTDLMTSFPALGPVERSRALQSPHAPCFVYVSAELIPF